MAMDINKLWNDAKAWFQYQGEQLAKALPKAMDTVMGVGLPKAKPGEAVEASSYCTTEAALSGRNDFMSLSRCYRGFRKFQEANKARHPQRTPAP